MDLSAEAAVADFSKVDSNSATQSEDAELSGSSEADNRANETIDKIEQEVEKAYNVLEQSASQWGAKLSTAWGSFLKSSEEVINENKKKLSTLELEQKLKDLGLENTVEKISKFDIQDISGKLNELKSNLDKQVSLNDDSNQEIVDIAAVAKEKEQVVATQGRKMLDILAIQAQQYVEDLDHDLEEIQKGTQGFVTRLGGLLKSAVTLEPSSDSELTTTEADRPGEVVFEAESQIYTSRLEAQLHTINTSQDLYLTEAVDDAYAEYAKTFKVDDHTSEITQLLKTYPELQSTMSLLVPTKIKYDEFWCRYFYMKQKIEEQDEKRKSLLRKAKDEEEEEDFQWDDDDDDEGSPREVQESEEQDKQGTNADDSVDQVTSSRRSSAEGTLELVSESSSTLEVVKSPRKKSSDDKDDTSDSDDDWE